MVSRMDEWTDQESGNVGSDLEEHVKRLRHKLAEFEEFVDWILESLGE